MTATLKIIHRSLVLEFFKQNAAFFGLILLVFFGFIKSSEHIAIGNFLVNNPEALLFVYALWLTYALKIVLFLLPTVNHPEYEFLAIYLLLDRQTKIVATLSAALFFMLPVVSYDVFLISLCVLVGNVIPIISLLGSLTVLVVLLALYINYLLARLPHEKRTFQFRAFKKITMPPQFFFISFLIRREVVLLIFTKLYGILLIISSTVLYRTDDFDLRVLTTGVLLSAVGNVAIIYKYVWFQYHPMAFSLNLPISFFKIALRQIITFAILLIPEFLVLLRHYPLDPGFYDISGLLLFSIGLCYLMFAWMIRKQTALSDFMIAVFWIIVLTTFFILFSIHPVILGFFMLAISLIITYIRYFRYEHLE